LHFLVEEREQQGPDVGAVHVGVGHDDDLVVAGVVDVEALAHAGADRRDDGPDLLVALGLVDARRLVGEDLASRRADSLEAAFATLFTMPSTSQLPSLVLVCPSSCGSFPLMCSTAVSPSRMSSPVSVNSSFLRAPSFMAHSLIVRVSAARKPVRCVPPSCVLMLFTKESVLSL